MERARDVIEATSSWRSGDEVPKLNGDDVRELRRVLGAAVDPPLDTRPSARQRKAASEAVVRGRRSTACTYLVPCGGKAAAKRRPEAVRERLARPREAARFPKGSSARSRESRARSPRRRAWILAPRPFSIAVTRAIFDGSARDRGQAERAFGCEVCSPAARWL